MGLWIDFLGDWFRSWYLRVCLFKRGSVLPTANGLVFSYYYSSLSSQAGIRERSTLRAALSLFRVFMRVM